MGVEAAVVWSTSGWEETETAGFGWERSQSAGRRQSARLQEMSQKSFSSGVPSGPDGPVKMSPKIAAGNPGRPDWHRMMAESANGHNPTGVKNRRTSSNDRPSSENGENDDEYPDEMTEVCPPISFPDFPDAPLSISGGVSTAALGIAEAGPRARRAVPVQDVI